MTSSVEFVPQFGPTLGILWIGTVITAALYGTGSSQVFVFFQSFPHERPIVKCTVISVWVMDTLHTIFVGHVAYTSMVSHFADAPAVATVSWSMWASLLSGSTVDTIVRLFFVFRLWRLSRRNVALSLSMVIITSLILLSSIVLSILGFMKVHTTTAMQRYSWAIYLELSFVCLGDIWLALWLNYYVTNTRKITRARESTSIFNTLLVYTVNTGSLNSILSVLCLITYAKLRTTYADFALLFLLTPLYVNAMLSTLNVRNWSYAGVDDAQVPIMTINGNPTIPVAFADAPPSEVHIHVNKEVVMTA